MSEFLQRLGSRILFFDGAMGTLLQQNGLTAGELPELWNLTHPQVVESIHRSYLEAGCDVITTNTFGANALKLRESGHTVAEVVTAAVQLARRAAASCGREAFVALDLGPTGKLLRPLGDLDFEEAVALYAEVVRAGAEAGADLVLVETMGDTLECKAAVLAAKEACTLPVIATMIFDRRGKLLTGGDIPAAVAMLEGLGVDALGFNCGLGPVQMLELLPELLACRSVPLLIQPNAGLPRSENGQTVFDVTPADFAASMKRLAEAGCWLLGGCCGTSPAHIAAAVAACRDVAPQPFVPCRDTVVSSYSHAVVIGKCPVVVGERINPTGKSRFKQALREHDINYILSEGVAQQQNGAHILDVNVGLPEVDEPALMEEAVCALQGVLDLPLQIDTSDPAAMERALRRYNGKAMLNSVNGKAESMAQIFPLMKKYGGVAVCLTLDEAGIPATAEGRLAVAEKIVAAAEACGIDRKNLIVDPLTMTISTGADAANVTLQALRLIREKLGVRTILGVSNVSFGLPRRELVTSAFFAMALQSGLDAAIINPGSEAMMQTYRAGCALLGCDPQCGRYIAAYGGTAAAPAAVPAGALSLHEAILRGLRDRAHHAALELLREQPPLAIIGSELVPALDEVGRGFERGTVFLPQLLMSAEAARAAFEALRSGFGEGEAEAAKKETVILATVKGDIHDIGKNIVRVLLENYSYRVIDLGKDVAPEAIVEAVQREHAPLVGLSALMTTTVAGMEETIALLRRTCPDCRVMVGGAVLTQEYADRIGADAYAPDAMGAVHYAQRLFGHGE